MKKEMRSPRTFAKANILRTPKHLRGGFTLIELLVVVLIIAILAAVALPQYTAAVTKARMTEYMVMTKAILGAQERYLLANDEYATSIEQLDISIPADYTVCRSTASQTIYSNGKAQIIVSSTALGGMGYITTQAACAVPNTNLGAVMVYVEGLDPSCPASEGAPCILCFGRTDSVAQKACASLGSYAGLNGSSVPTYHIAR
ncbi:prepilin-type N-terminal cleavage/methylation domain-containing protein [Parelusimicrobium proximum]|uniref:type IV pilin protein n=1 Tax=Parelusimicrobium proximum TaxID=3228953 RepID=UPI003D175D77